MEEGRKAVFLDRDGTLIRERGYLGDPAQVALEEGAADAVARLRAKGFAVVMVTNQSGVARGYYTEDDVVAVHEAVESLLEAGGGGLDGTYYCPHYPEGEVGAYIRVCSCRKPEGGMLLKAAEELGLRLEGSYMIGDKLTDAEAARRQGLTGILVRTGQGEEAWKACLQEPAPERPDRVVLDLREAADFIFWSERTLGTDVPRDPRGGRPSLWSSKWVSRRFLEKCLEAHRHRGETIVLAEGIFDLVHAGHVGYLQSAGERGDVLVVALHDDRSVRERQGAGRPVLRIEDRLEIVSAMACVDYCVVFNDTMADPLLDSLKPVLHARRPDLEAATSDLIRRIRALNKRREKGS